MGPNKNGPFDLDNLSLGRKSAWEYEDLNPITRIGIERRGLKRKRNPNGLTGIRSVKRRLSDGGSFVPRSARRLFLILLLVTLLEGDLHLYSYLEKCVEVMLIIYELALG